MGRLTTREGCQVPVRRSALAPAVAAVAVLASALSIVDCATKRPPGPSAESPQPPSVTPPPAPPPPPTRPGVEEGIASWYGPGFDGRETANGEIYDQEAMTAAHPSLAFGTRVRVTLVGTGRHVIVRINDRGPWFDGRVIDLSRAAGAALGLMRPGIAPVRLEILAGGAGRRSASTGDRVLH
jgi:rare lipoprotein A (peptidoglycan hydrolase)